MKKTFLIFLAILTLFILSGCGGGGGSDINGLNYSTTPKEEIKIDKLTNIDKNISYDIVKLSLDDSLFEDLYNTDILSVSNNDSSKHYKIVDKSKEECPLGGSAKADDENYVVVFNNCKKYDVTISGVIDYENPNSSYNFKKKFIGLNWD